MLAAGRSVLSNFLWAEIVLQFHRAARDMLGEAYP
jgi:hypothetical protein